MNHAESVDLLSRARTGSHQALGALLESCAGRLLGLIRLRLGPQLRRQLESRDILQTTLLRAFERIEQFEGEDRATLGAWLARIADHEIRDRRDYFRRQKREAALNVGLEEVGAGLAAQVRGVLTRVLQDERQRQLETALETLKPEYREVILLRRFEELSFAEVGRRMGRGADACRMLMARAMAALTLKMTGPPGDDNAD